MTDVFSRLDEQHQAAVEAMPPNLFGHDDIDKVRRRFDAMMNAKPSPLPDNVSVVDHGVEGFEGHEMLVRTYARVGREGSSGGLYWIHGGGMILGDVAMSDFGCAQLADKLGIMVASVEYRLAPEYPFPVPLEDCYAGLKWFFDNAEEFGVDTDRIAIGGASAGGGLAAGLALLARDRNEVSPCFQLLTYPMLDDRNDTLSSHEIFDARLWNRQANDVGWNAYLSGAAGTADVSPYAAPARAADLTGLPPAYVTVGELDMFVDEDVTYAQRLLQAGVRTELHVYPGCFHGSDGWVPKAPMSRRWRRDELEALRAVLCEVADHGQPDGAR